MSAKISLALVKAQKEFAPALKSTKNEFFKSKYADLAACVEAVIDALNNHGIYLLQKSHDSDNGVKVETVLIHESGESISGGILHVPAAKNDPQGYGSALTYARRYSLMATCGIAPEDDDGNAATNAVKAQPKKEEPKLDEKLIKDSESVLEVAASFGTDTLKKAWADLTPELRKALNEKLAALKETAAKNDELIATQA
jgi:hypothetical protein